MPFFVSGISSSTTNADGTMYSGSDPRTCARSSSTTTPNGSFDALNALNDPFGVPNALNGSFSALDAPKEALVLGTT
ncbi:hypothetical protein GCM10022247_68690 [Allokutzneria multivorans]|uniref:Uncharacterized protein n=1 Tax=Allokutzneria multivorans TaxID=1142134 RepID=A0ABP7U0R9_9PSEU